MLTIAHIPPKQCIESVHDIAFVGVEHPYLYLICTGTIRNIYLTRLEVQNRDRSCCVYCFGILILINCTVPLMARPDTLLIVLPSDP